MYDRVVESVRVALAGTDAPASHWNISPELFAHTWSSLEAKIQRRVAELLKSHRTSGGLSASLQSSALSGGTPAPS